MGIPKSTAESFVKRLSITDIVILLNNPDEAMKAITSTDYTAPSKKLAEYFHVPSMTGVNNSLSECFTKNGWDDDPLVKQLGKEARERKARWEKRKAKLIILGWLILIVGISLFIVLFM